MQSTLDAEEHFAFGENWQSFVRVLDDDRIKAAELGMNRLFPNGELEGASFLDIGCGSGLSSLAAARLGVARIDAIDVDSVSIAATNETLSRYAPRHRWSVRARSVFDLSPISQGTYDVVYSWGVLHHTGDMWRAVRIAASMVKPGGYLAVALYRRTPMCAFWVREKRFYSRAPRSVQTMIRGAYKAAWSADMLLRKKTNPRTHIREYRTRGMDWSHDVHDWLGGYPYESAEPKKVWNLLDGLGFKVVREFLLPDSFGLWGSGCDEFVAIRHVN